MKPEEIWTLTDYWNDLQKGDLEVETYIRVGNELADHATQLEESLMLERQRTGRFTSALLKSGDLVEIAGEFVPRSQLEDDVLRNTISLLKNENERLTDRIEELEALLEGI